ncbi:MAG TPA: hypothetical protein VGB26_13085 [Nitrospiria bacterium]
MTLSANGYARIDDLLFIYLANSLSEGDWLGPYTTYTLAKGPFYPAWIAATHLLGIPLLLGQHLLYIGACALFILAIRPVVPNPKALCLIFFLLIFNPISYTDEVMTRVIREGIYPALTLMVFAFCIGVLLRHDRSLKILSIWFMGLGVSLSVFWLTREEGVWIIPSLLFILGFAFFKIWKEESPDRIQRLALFILPFGIWMITIATISGVNQLYYGISKISEFKSKEFLAAYGSLSRVKHSNWHPRIPVPREVRVQLYMISPAFAQLKPLLEGGFGKGWAAISCQSISVCNDIGGGWFMWAFRDAATIAGNHASGKAAADYYKRLAREINSACAKGQLICEKERATMMPVWHSAYNWAVIKTFFHGLTFLVSFENAKPYSKPSIGTEKTLKIIHLYTKEKLSPKTDPSSKTKTDDLGLFFLTLIGLVYQWGTPILFILALVTFTTTTFHILQGGGVLIPWIIKTAFLIAVATRLGILSVIEVTSFPALNTLYLAPAYPLVLIFTALVLSNINFKSFLSSSKSE